MQNKKLTPIQLILKFSIFLKPLKPHFFTKNCSKLKNDPTKVFRDLKNPYFDARINILRFHIFFQNSQISQKFFCFFSKRSRVSGCNFFLNSIWVIRNIFANLQLAPKLFALLALFGNFSLDYDPAWPSRFRGA